MFYLVLIYKFLITNECGTVFGRQGPEVHKIAWSDFGRRRRPPSNLLTPTNDINYLTRVSESEIQFSIP